MVQKQQSLDEQSHTSVVDSPTASVDRQSSQGQAEKSKSVSFEDEEEVKPERRKMTVRERWHWAYNKIVMQLNVSTLPIFKVTAFSLVLLERELLYEICEIRVQERILNENVPAANKKL
jgi:hypothetical protein